MVSFCINLIGDHILIRPFSNGQELHNRCGVIVPDSTDESPLCGMVMEVGDGIGGRKMALSSGDVVLYHQKAGLEIICLNEKYLIMRQSDILATF